MSDYQVAMMEVFETQKAQIEALKRELQELRLELGGVVMTNEALTAENKWLRASHDALIKRMADLVALTPPDPIVIARQTLAGKDEK